MAYFSQEMKKKVAPQIKAVLKKYKMKGSISVGNHSTLCVNIKSGELDFQKDSTDRNQKFGGGAIDLFHHQINEFWFDEHFTGETQQFLTELYEAMKGDMWYDNTDAQIDYFDTAFYTHVNVGNYAKKYEYTGNNIQNAAVA